MTRCVPVPEPLEQRTLLSSDVQRALQHAVAAEASSLAVPAAVDTANQRFVSRIAGMLTGGLSARFEASLVQQLDRGLPRSSAVAIVLRTPAARRAEVVNTYQTLLNRNPSGRELHAGLAAFAHGGDQLAVIQQVAQSRTYYQTRGGGTAAGFVNALAADLLGRAPTQAEASAWLGALAGGESRGQLVAGLLQSPAYVEAAAQELANQATPGAPGASLASSIASTLAGPGPQRLAQAESLALSSDQFMATLLAPPSLPPATPTAPTAPAAPGLRAPGLPITPTFSLTTGWVNIAPSGVTLLDVNAIGASPQGTFWFATNQSGLLVYNVVSASTTSAWNGPVQSVAPVSDTSAWIIGSNGAGPGGTLIGKVTVNGAMTTAANLPGGDIPAQIAAAPDGTVWVLGQSGQVYSYSAASNAWASIASNGFTIEQISVGSASNIWAIGKSQGTAVVLQWTQGSGWSVDHDFNGVTPTQIAATSDQSVWAVIAGLSPYVLLKPPGGTWGFVENQTPPGTIALIAATDRNRLVAASTGVDQPFNVLSFGLVDRPAVAFPDVTSQWQLGYNAINQAFGITVPGGIRSLYNDQLANLSTWYTKLTTGQVPIPLGISATNWSTITNQIANEINDVMAVNRLFTAMNELNQAIATVSTDQLSAATRRVGLTTQQKKDDTLALAIEGMFEAALAGVAASFSGNAAVAAATIASGIDNLIAGLTNDPNPNPSTKLKETEAKLSTSLANLFTSNLTDYGQEQTKIVQDYGMLTALGNAVNSGQWTWDDTQTPALANAAKNGFARFFYQALMPDKWKIVYVHDYLCDLYVCPHISSPNYATYTVVIERGTNTVLEDVYFMNALGASSAAHNNPGPYPAKSLIQAIEGLGVAPGDLLRARNGWNLKFVPATY